jgi:hypothetical protein
MPARLKSAKPSRVSGFDCNSVPGCYTSFWSVAAWESFQPKPTRPVAQHKPQNPFLAEIGARAGADYQGDGLSILPTQAGALLRCVFQKLEGEATPGGLWLISTAPESDGERFRVVARAVGRQDAMQSLAAQGAVQSALTTAQPANRTNRCAITILRMIIRSRALISPVGAANEFARSENSDFW